MKEKKKETLSERVEELEAEVRFLKWLIDKHIYKESTPIWYPIYPTDGTANPNPLPGWRV